MISTRNAARLLILLALALVGAGLTVPALAVPGEASSAAPGNSVAADPMIVRPPGSYVALSPSRVLDTRKSTGPIRAGQSIALQVLGVGGIVTSSVGSVVLNVTVVNPSTSGYLTAYADRAPRPQTSNIDFSAGQTVANMVIVPVGVDGRVQFYYGGGGGTLSLVVDVAGFYVTAGSPAGSGPPAAAGTFMTVPAKRVLDTRTGVGGARASLPAGGSRALTLTGVAGVPKSGVRAVALNVAATGATANGFVTVYPAGAARPGVSSLHFGTGMTVANLVIVPVSGSGQVVLFNGSSRPINALADIVGYYVAGNPGVLGSLLALPQTRLLDTAHGVGSPARAVAPNGTFSLQVGGVGLIPKSGMIAVALEVTAVAPAAPGYLTAYPAGVTRPTTSNLDFTRRATVSNLVIVPIRPDGRIQLFNASGGGTHLTVDLVGVYLDGTGAARCNAVGLDTKGTAITRWNPLVSCILSVLGQAQSAGNISDVDLIIRYESSGDPNAINNYDINYQEGHPSEGLIQVIRPTFDAWRSPRLANDLLNPAANLYAGLNYAIHTYGSIHNVPGLVSLRGGGGYVGYIAHK